MSKELDIESLNELLSRASGELSAFITLYNSMTMAVAGSGLSNPVGPSIANGLDEVARAIENGLSEVASAHASGLSSIADAIQNIAVVLDYKA